MENLEEYILSLFKKGATEEDVAKQVTDSINKAIAEQKKQEEAERAEFQEKITRKAAEQIADALGYFYNAFNEPELAKSFDCDEGIEELIAILKETIKIAKSDFWAKCEEFAEKLEKELKSLSDDPKPKKPIELFPKKQNDTDSVLNKFLRDMGWE